MSPLVAGPSSSSLLRFLLFVLLGIRTLSSLVSTVESDLLVFDVIFIYLLVLLFSISEYSILLYVFFSSSFPLPSINSFAN